MTLEKKVISLWKDIYYNNLLNLIDSVIHITTATSQDVNGKCG